MSYVNRFVGFIVSSIGKFLASDGFLYYITFLFFVIDEVNKDKFGQVIDLLLGILLYVFYIFRILKDNNEKNSNE